MAAVVERVRVQREAAEAAEQLRVEQEQLRMEQAQREALEAAKRATAQAEAERLAAEQAQQEALTLTHRNAEFRRNIAESWTRKFEV